MNTVDYISHKLLDNIEEVKMLSLYFDEINIVEQNNIHIVTPFNSKPNKKGYIKAEVIETRDYTDDLFIEHLRTFESEKIIKYTKHIINPPESPSGMYSLSNHTIINNLIINGGLIGESKVLDEKKQDNGSTIFTIEYELNKESEYISKNFFPNSKTTNELMIYYGRLASSFFDKINEGKNVITTSKLLNKLYSIAIQNGIIEEVGKKLKDEINVSPFIAYEAIKLNVPNIGNHPIDEILEFRYKSNDELCEFRKTLENLTVDILGKYDSSYIQKNANRLIELKIQPQLENIKDKLKDSKYRGFRQLVEQIKDPKSYSPLLLTFSDNVSNTLALMISLGIISFNTALEYFQNNKEIRKDGIYYLLKLNKYFS